MGNSIRKIYLNNNQIIQDIVYINKITNDKLFEKRVGMLINFKFNKISRTISCIFVFKLLI
jgi:hypothetical protein